MSSEEKRELRELRRKNPGAGANHRNTKSRNKFLRAGVRPATAMICVFIDAHRDEFGVVPICRALAVHGVQIAPRTYWAHRVGGAVETGAVGHHDHRNPGRLLRARRRGETPAGEPVRQPEDVGAPATPGHPGGAVHSGEDHAGQRLARRHPGSAPAAHDRIRSGRKPGAGPGRPAMASGRAEPSGRGRLHLRADGLAGSATPRSSSTPTPG